MAEIVIEAQEREAGSSNAARRMRREEKLPAVVYGGDKESTPIILNPREIISVLKSESGQNTIFKLKVAGGAEDNVMIFDVQIDPITYNLIHADLMRIAMDVDIEVSVPLRIVGDAKGVVEDGGVLDHSLRELVVSCLPGNIPENIEVDVSELEMNESIKIVEQLIDNIPAGDYNIDDDRYTTDAADGLSGWKQGVVPPNDIFSFPEPTWFQRPRGSISWRSSSHSASWSTNVFQFMPGV